MKRLWAKDVLRDRAGDLTAPGMYNVVLAATGDENAAQDAMSDRIADQLRRGREVDL
jgi:hypothetical protein